MKIEEDRQENLKTQFKALLEEKHLKPTVRVWSRADDEVLQAKVQEGWSYKEISKLFNDKGPLICQRRVEKLKKKENSWPQEIE